MVKSIGLWRFDTRKNQKTSVKNCRELDVVPKLQTRGAATLAMTSTGKLCRQTRVIMRSICRHASAIASLLNLLGSQRMSKSRQEGMKKTVFRIWFKVVSSWSGSLESSYFKTLLTNRSTIAGLEESIFWFFFCFLLGLCLDLRSWICKGYDLCESAYP